MDSEGVKLRNPRTTALIDRPTIRSGLARKIQDMGIHGRFRRESQIPRCKGDLGVPPTAYLPDQLAPAAHLQAHSCRVLDRTGALSSTL